MKFTISPLKSIILFLTLLTSVSVYGFQIGPCSNELPELLITTETSWNTPQTFNRNIRVKSGVTLNINTLVEMGDGKYIEVERGAKLNINGGHLTHLCDDYWQGIYVHGNASEEQPDPESSQPLDLDGAGVVIIKDSKIEYAVAGVHTFGKSIPELEKKKYNGGVIFVDRSVFLNNIVGVKFEDYQFHNKSNFSKTTFEQNSDKLDNQRKVGGSIQGCEEIGFDYCNFNRLFAGIFGINFGARIIDGNSFVENGYGIVRLSFSPIYNWLVIGHELGQAEDNVFKRNGYGVYIVGDTGPLRVDVSHNDFLCGRIGVGLQNGGRGYLNNNLFDEVPYSIVADNSGSTYARCNAIFNSRRGIEFMGNCQNSAFLGNRFKKTDYNVVISEDNGIPGQVNNFQGNPFSFTPADNCFGLNAQEKIAIQGNTVPFFYFVRSQNSLPCHFPENNPSAYGIFPLFPGEDVCMEDFIADDPEEELSNIRDSVSLAEVNLLNDPESEYWEMKYQSFINHREALKLNLITKYLQEKNFVGAENVLIGEDIEVEKRWLYGISLKKGNIEEAKARLELIGTNNNEDLFFTQTQEIYLETIERIEPFVLTADQRSILENIVSIQNNSKGIAESLLMVFDAEKYQLPETVCPECECSADLYVEEKKSKGKEFLEAKIYPNPANELININITNVKQNTPVEVEIYNSQGALEAVKSFPENLSTLTVNTVNFTAGLYYLRIYQGNELILVDKLVIMK